VLGIGHEIGFEVGDKKKTIWLINADVQVLVVLNLISGYNYLCELILDHHY
jgi:hypothetical protein